MGRLDQWLRGAAPIRTTLYQLIEHLDQLQSERASE
jgi:hypothetical protein